MKFHKYLACLIFAGLLVMIRAEVSWRGYCAIGDRYFFNLSADEAHHSEWMQLGEIFAGVQLREYDAKQQTLVILVQNSGREVRLALQHASVANVPKGIAPLSREEALAIVHKLLQLPLNTTGRKIDYTSLPASVRDEIEARASAPIPIKPTAQMTPVEMAEYLASLDKAGLVLVQDTPRDGHPYRALLAPLRLDNLPPELAANLTQQDLDQLLGDQAKAVATQVETLQNKK